MNFISKSLFEIALIIIFSSIQQGHAIKLKFNKTNHSSITSLSNLYHNYIGVELCFGTPEQQCLILNLEQSTYPTWLIDSESKCKSDDQIGYNCSKSHSISFKNEYQTIYNYDKFERAYSSLDTIFLNNQPNSPRMNDFFFLLSNLFSDIDMNSGVIGLNIQNSNINTETIGSNFIEQLYEKNIISSYQYIIHYTSEDSGELIIGEEMINSDDQIELIHLKPISSGIVLRWGIDIDQIQSGNSQLIHRDQKAALQIEQGFIIGTEKYGEYLYTTFFKKYLDIGKCSYQSFQVNFFGYYCDIEVSNIDLSTFETLNFNIGNYVYELEAKDLFTTIDMTIYFLVIFPRKSFYYVNIDWILGEPFYKKYIMTFNQDKKEIGIYTPKKCKVFIDPTNNNNMIKGYSIGIMIIISFLGVLLGLFVLFLIYIIYKKVNRRMKMIDYSLFKD